MPQTKPEKQTKSDFIRSQPDTLSAAEVVEQGKAAGVKFDAFLVYKVRSRAKGKKGPRKVQAAPHKLGPAVAKAPSMASSPAAAPKTAAKAKRRGPNRATKREARVVLPRKGPGVVRPIASSSSAEELLKALAAELGLGRAIEVLEGDRARVRDLIRG